MGKAEKKADEPTPMFIPPLPIMEGDEASVGMELKRLELERERLRAEMIRRLLEMDRRREKNYIV